jgi:hypothetical protein
MGKFPIQYSEATPSGKGANVPLNVNVRTGWESLERGEEAIGGAMFGMGQDIENAENVAELSTLQRQYHEEQNAFFDNLPKLSDPDDMIKFREMSIQKASNKVSKRKKVNDAWTKFTDKENPAWEAMANATIREKRIQRVTDDLKLNGDELLRQGRFQEYATLLHNAEATGAMSDKARERAVIDMYRNSAILQAEDLNNDPNPQTQGASALRARDILSAYAAKSYTGEQLKKAAQESGEAGRTLKNQGQLEAKAKVDAAKSRIALTKQRNYNLPVEEKRKMVEPLLTHYINEGGENPEAEGTELNAWANKDVVQEEIDRAEEKLKVAGAEANKQLTDLMTKGALTIPEIEARRNILPDNDYISWSKVAMNPPDKKGNVIETASLKSGAIDVWRGSITREDLDSQILTSLASPDGINDKQYAEIVSAADQKLEQSQADDIRRFSRDAANVILGQYSGLMTFDALGNLTGVNLAGLSDDKVEDAKYRMHYLSLYEQDLRDYIRTNPKVNGRDFEVYAAEQKMKRWNTTLETMKEIAKAQGKTGTTTQIPTPTKPANVPADAVWDENRKMWTYVRNGRLKGMK